MELSPCGEGDSFYRIKVKFSKFSLGKQNIPEIHFPVFPLHICVMASVSIFYLNILHFGAVC